MGGGIKMLYGALADGSEANTPADCQASYHVVRARVGSNCGGSIITLRKYGVAEKHPFAWLIPVILIKIDSYIC